MFRRFVLFSDLSRTIPLLVERSTMFSARETPQPCDARLFLAYGSLFFFFLLPSPSEKKKRPRLTVMSQACRLLLDCLKVSAFLSTKVEISSTYLRKYLARSVPIHLSFCHGFHEPDHVNKICKNGACHPHKTKDSSTVQIFPYQATAIDMELLHPPLWRKGLRVRATTPLPPKNDGSGGATHSSPTGLLLTVACRTVLGVCGSSNAVQRVSSDDQIDTLSCQTRALAGGRGELLETID